MTKKKANAAVTAKWIIIIGLAIQIIFLFLFITVSTLFHHRMRKSPTLQANRIPGLWQTYLAHLYVASLLILTRSIFRLVEYIQGEDGYLMRHEIFLYVFDAMLVACVMLLFNMVHPSMVTALQRGEKAIWVVRVRTLEKLEDDEVVDLSAVNAVWTGHARTGEAMA